jgi:NhaA family Na+:H+ antiporter
MMPHAVLRFLKTDAAGGLVLAACAALALLIANSPLGPLFHALLHRALPVDLGPLSVHLTTVEWIKDGLMPVFFFVIGLELKRELVEGELSDRRAVVLPVAAALGGMVVPALVYLLVSDSTDLRGWPVPVATDIAFALAALAIFARSVPTSLRIFLLTLAVVDDLGAVILIGVLFSHDLALLPLAGIGLCLAVLTFTGRLGKAPSWIWGAGALLIWVLTLKSGIHTSVAGVAAAFTVPLSGGRLERLERALHPVSAYVVLPLFAIASAGISLAGLSGAAMFSVVPLGIALALALGKPIGVLGASYLVQSLGLARLPTGARFADMLGMACFCGIGFTMSLFLGALAFRGDETAELTARLGIVAGSVLALLLGAGIFAIWDGDSRKRPAAH